MDNFRNNYGEFNKDLTTFVELVSQRYKTGAPNALQNLKLIPTVLPTNDPALVAGNITAAASKFLRLQRVTSHVFAFLQPCVREEFHESVHDQIKKLIWEMNLCATSLCAAIMKPDNDGVTDMSAGISGVNRGVTVGIDPETRHKMKELRSAIQKFASQMR